MTELVSRSQFAVLMSSEIVDAFRRENRDLYDRTKIVELSFIEGENAGIDAGTSAMTDEDVLAYLPLADLELRTADAIIEDAIDMENGNIAKIARATQDLNSRAGRIEAAMNALRECLTSPDS